MSHSHLLSVYLGPTNEEGGWPGSARNGLFYLDPILRSNSIFFISGCNKFDLWHSCLAHLSRLHLDFILKNFQDVIANKD